MRLNSVLLMLLSTSCLSLVAFGEQPTPPLPKVVLIGDSIRLGYTATVQADLAGAARIVSPQANGGDSANVLAHLDEWVIRERPDVVHFNCGIHDTKKDKATGSFQVSPDEYASNLRQIVQRIRDETDAAVLFATTTPILDDRATATRAERDYELLNAGVLQYNEIARDVMENLGVPVNDLYAAVGNVESRTRLMGRDGVHFTDKGKEILGKAVTAFLRRHAFGSSSQPQEWDVVVYGGTSAGVTAAVQSARMGMNTVLVEPSRHVGAMTASGLGATDFKIKESIGGMAMEFYLRIGDYYRNPSAWKYGSRGEYVSHGYDVTETAMYYFEPHVAEKIFREMLKEAEVNAVFGERLDLRDGVEMDQGRIAAIHMESGRTFSSKVFIDATFEGDLMAVAGVPFHVGREGNGAYGETLNGIQKSHLPYSGHKFFRPIDPYVTRGDPASGLIFQVSDSAPGTDGTGDHRVQAYCFRLCTTDVPENRVPFPKPPGYDPARYELLLRYVQSEEAGAIFDDFPDPPPIEHPVLGRNPYIKIMPNRKTDSNSKGAVSFNLVGGNYDYPNADYETRERIVAEHKNWQQGLVYFVGNDPRVPERFRKPLANWGLAKDEFVDNGNWPYQLYIREARRMIGRLVMTEQHCLGELAVDDPICLGSYTMDSHITRYFVDSDGYVRAEGTIGGRVPRPYGISYRSIVPQDGDCTNLLVPVCLSASHVAYGSIRMEPVFMMLGQSAAVAAKMAIEDRLSVQTVPYPDLRQQLFEVGQKLQWYEQVRN